MSLAAALFVIQICAAIGAESAAVTAADDLHRQSQQDLLTKYVCQEQPFPLKKPNLCVAFLQLRLFGTLPVRQRAIEKIERAMHFIDNRLEATSAHHLDLSLDFAGNPNLAFDQFRGRRNFQRFDLLHFRGLVIDAAGRVTLADDLFPDSKVLDIKKHVCGASGADAHAFSLLGRFAAKSRKRGGFSLKRVSWNYRCATGNLVFRVRRDATALRDCLCRPRPSSEP